MYIRKKNNENARIKRPAKRIKSYDVFFTSGYGLYLKPMAIFSALITLDFLMEIRVEYLWSCWFLIKSASESYKYQGLIFSLFFVLIVLTSDIICYLLIPVTWLFFIASSYVWVQLVGQTERGICLPTIAISLLFLYLEYLLRFRTFNQLAFGVGICKPFAAHGIGYPVVKMGFGLKTYVSYRFRIRKQRDVEAVNRFHFQLIDQALPDCNRRFRIQAAEDHESSSVGSDSMENSSFEVCQNNQNHTNSINQNNKDATCISHKLSKSNNIPNGKLDHNNHHHNYQNHQFPHSSDVLNSKNSTGVSSGSLEYVKQWALTNSHNSQSANNTKQPPNGHVVKHGNHSNHQKTHNHHHNQQQQIISTSNNATTSSNGCTGELSSNTGPNLSSTLSLQHGNSNSCASSTVSSASSVSSTSSRSSVTSITTSSSKHKKSSVTPASTATNSVSTTSSSTNTTTTTTTLFQPPSTGSDTKNHPSHHPSTDTKSGNINKKNSKSTNKEDASYMKYELDLKKLRTEVQHARTHEQELKSQLSTLNQSYQTTKRELSQSRNESTQVQHKLDSLHKKLSTEKQTAQQLEKKLADEKKNVLLLEQQLTNEKKARKEECEIKNKALQSATIAAAKPTDCTESCKSKRRQMEVEIKNLKKERQNLDDQLTQLELQVMELPKLRKLADELLQMSQNINHLRDEKDHLVRTLSDENKIKQNLITAYHSSLKEVNALNEQLTEKDYQILQLNVNSAMHNQANNLPSSSSPHTPTTNSNVSIDHQQQQHQQQHINQHINPYHSQYHIHQQYHHQPPQNFHPHHSHQIMQHRNTPTSPSIMDQPPQQQHITSTSASLYHHNNIVSSPSINNNNSNIFFGDLVTTSSSASPPSSIANGVLGSSNNKLNITSTNNSSSSSNNNSSHMIHGNGLYSNSNLSHTTITSANSLVFGNDTNNNINTSTNNPDVSTNTNHTGHNNNNNKSKNLQHGPSTTNNSQVSSW